MKYSKLINFQYIVLLYKSRFNHERLGWLHFKHPGYDWYYIGVPEWLPIGGPKRYEAGAMNPFMISLMICDGNGNRIKWKYKTIIILIQILLAYFRWKIFEVTDIDNV